MENRKRAILTKPASWAGGYDRAVWESTLTATVVAPGAERGLRRAPSEDAAHAYAQLQVFPEWSVERIARRTGRPTAAVRDAIATARLQDDVRRHVLAGSLTLDQASLGEESK